MKPEDLPEVLTTGQVAKLWNLSPKTISEQARRGEIPSFRTVTNKGRGHRRYHRDEILALRERARANTVLTMIRELVHNGHRVEFVPPDEHGNLGVRLVEDALDEPSEAWVETSETSVEMALFAAWQEAVSR